MTVPFTVMTVSLLPYTDSYMFQRTVLSAAPGWPDPTPNPGALREVGG